MNMDFQRAERMLADRLVRESSKDIKIQFEDLLGGGNIRTQIDEQIMTVDIMILSGRCSPMI